MIFIMPNKGKRITPIWKAIIITSLFIISFIDKIYQIFQQLNCLQICCIISIFLLTIYFYFRRKIIYLIKNIKYFSIDIFIFLIIDFIVILIKTEVLEVLINYLIINFPYFNIIKITITYISLKSLFIFIFLIGVQLLLLLILLPWINRQRQ